MAMIAFPFLLLMCLFTKSMSQNSTMMCDAETAAQCEAAAPCYEDNGGCMMRDTEAPFEWSGPFVACNEGAALCASCYPESSCSIAVTDPTDMPTTAPITVDDMPTTAPITVEDPCEGPCVPAAPCYEDNGGCMMRDTEAPFEWSGPFVACNEGAALCASCYPESSCSFNVTEPVTSAPVTSTPDTTAPATTAPATTAPSTTAPVTSAPVTSAPVTSAPVTTPTTTPTTIPTTIAVDPPKTLSPVAEESTGSALSSTLPVTAAFLLSFLVL